MNAHLHDLIDHAEANLGAADRDKLAVLLESFLATHEGEEPFSEEERAHLSRLDAEPFEPADPAEVAVFFARRG
jgi:hypothetical protein